MRRCVLDTNILIADAYRPGSASGRIVQWCLDGRIEAVVSPALIDEYRFILPRAVRSHCWADRLERLLHGAHIVEPGATPRVILEDPSDDMLFAAALAGGSDAIVTSDRAVLRACEAGGVQVWTPHQAMEQLGNPLGA